MKLDTVTILIVSPENLEIVPNVTLDMNLERISFVTRPLKDVEPITLKTHFVLSVTKGMLWRKDSAKRPKMKDVWGTVQLIPKNVSFAAIDLP